MLSRAARGRDRLREVNITPGFLRHHPASVLMEMGNTRVLCTASIEERTPAFKKNTGQGWLAAEYSMLPMSTNVRSSRESVQGRLQGRTHEIQRLIGRSLRAVTDLGALPEKTVTVDCDVLEADGGTRTAAITGGFVALTLLFAELKERRVLTRIPVTHMVAAVSAGMLAGEAYLDLNYEEDSHAEVDMNLVMTSAGRFIEIQGTGEKGTFSRGELLLLTDLAMKGINELFAKQRLVIGDLI